MSGQEQQQEDARSGSPPGGLNETQRKVFVERELQRMKHVLNRLAVQESRSSKRAQIAELRAREVEGVRHESERDAKVREQVMVERRDHTVRQHERVTLLREDRKRRAESSRRDMRTQKMEMARMTKEQTKVINQHLGETRAERHDRCVQQHGAIRESEKATHSARARTVERKREQASASQAAAQKEMALKEQELQLLLERKEALERRLSDAKMVEQAAKTKYDSLTGAPATNSPNSSRMHSRAGAHSQSRSADGDGRADRGRDRDDVDSD